MDPGNEGVAPGLVGIRCREPDQPAVPGSADLPKVLQPAVQRRNRRVEEAGGIQANVAVVDPARVGQAITNVKRFRTVVAMDRVKVGLTIPLP